MRYDRVNSSSDMSLRVPVRSKKRNLSSSLSFHLNHQVIRACSCS